MSRLLAAVWLVAAVLAPTTASRAHAEADLGVVSGEQQAAEPLPFLESAGLLQNAAAIGAGHEHTCVLTAAGAVRCWGGNALGQLGDGTTIDRTTPVDVIGLATGVAAVAVGGDHTCALTLGGAVRCWGYNASGQLGNGLNTYSATPVDVAGLGSGVAAVAAGGDHTCALLDGGGVKCWGMNASGQLRDGTTHGSSVPVDVLGLRDGADAITAGLKHTCGVVSGAAVCWGQGYFGQLGNGGDDNSPTPVPVTGLGAGVASVVAGGYHTCAVLDDGSGRCWGMGFWGELGDGTNAEEALTPVAIAGQESPWSGSALACSIHAG